MQPVPVNPGTHVKHSGFELNGGRHANIPVGTPWVPGRWLAAEEEIVPVAVWRRRLRAGAAQAPARS